MSYAWRSKMSKLRLLADCARRWGNVADLMIKHGVGVTRAQTYVIPKVDQDYFAEE
jgi:hypothetical protein